MFVVRTICDGARNFSTVFSEAGVEGKLRLTPVIGGVVSMFNVVLRIILVLLNALGLWLAVASAVPRLCLLRRNEADESVNACGSWFDRCKIMTQLMFLEIGECLFAQIPVISNLYFAGRNREDRSPWRSYRSALNEALK